MNGDTNFRKFDDLSIKTLIHTGKNSHLKHDFDFNGDWIQSYVSEEVWDIDELKYKTVRRIVEKNVRYKSGKQITSDDLFKVYEAYCLSYKSYGMRDDMDRFDDAKFVKKYYAGEIFNYVKSHDAPKEAVAAFIRKYPNSFEAKKMVEYFGVENIIDDLSEYYGPPEFAPDSKKKLVNENSQKQSKLENTVISEERKLKEGLTEFKFSLESDTARNIIKKYKALNKEYKFDEVDWARKKVAEFALGFYYNNVSNGMRKRGLRVLEKVLTGDNLYLYERISGVYHGNLSVDKKVSLDYEAEMMNKKLQKEFF